MSIPDRENLRRAAAFQGDYKPVGGIGVLERYVIGKAWRGFHQRGQFFGTVTMYPRIGIDRLKMQPRIGARSVGNTR